MDRTYTDLYIVHASADIIEYIHNIQCGACRSSFSHSVCFLGIVPVIWSGWPACLSSTELIMYGGNVHSELAQFLSFSCHCSSWVKVIICQNVWSTNLYPAQKVDENDWIRLWSLCLALAVSLCPWSTNQGSGVAAWQLPDQTAQLVDRTLNLLHYNLIRPQKSPQAEVL